MKKFVLATIVCFAICFVFTFVIVDGVCFAEDKKSDEEIKSDLQDAYDKAVDNLDLKALQEFLNSLSQEGSEAISVSDIRASLKALARGEGEAFFEGFFNILAKSAGRYFLGFVPSFVTIVIICLLKTMLCGLTGDFLNTSTTEVVNIVCYCSVVIVLMSGVATVIETVVNTINILVSLSDALFPILLTLLSALGANASIAGYSPLMAVLCGFIMKLVTVVILPAFIACIVFGVVGNISKNVKLDKLSKLVKSASSWLIGIVFGLFATFLTMQGISGGVIDKFGFNIAKFAVSSYVPILGGYLSDGFDLMNASLVLVKNAVGYTGATLLCAAVAFPLVKVLMFSLAMRLAGAIVEPIGDTRTSTLLCAAAKDMNLLITALAGVAFLFFLLLMLLVSSCNMGL